MSAWSLTYNPAFKYAWTIVRDDKPFLTATGSPRRYGRRETAERVADQMNARDDVGDVIIDLISGFRLANPKLSIWERYPRITSNEDAWTDTNACETWSRRFAEFCQASEVDAVVMHATDAEEEMVDYHRWTRVGNVNVDWTARQYHNLFHPPRREHANLPCPLVWVGDQHPIVSFGSIRVQS